MEPKFKVGDRVKIIKKGVSNDSHEYFGEIVTLTEVTEHYVEFHDEIGGLYFDEIEHEEIANSALFKIMQETE